MRSLVFALLVVSLLVSLLTSFSASVMAGALAPAHAADPTAAPAGHSTTALAAAFLQKLKAAVTDETLVSQEPDRAEILERILGSGYRYATEDLGDGIAYTRFYSLDLYDPRSREDPAASAPEKQCIADGAISTTRHKPPALRQLDLYLRVKGDCSGDSTAGPLSAARVLEFFGPPTSLAAGAPYSPPHHGRWPPDESPARPLGNTWISYAFPSAHSLVRVEFNTGPVAEVIEIAVSVRER